MSETNIRYKKDSQVHSTIVYIFQIRDIKESVLESYIHKKILWIRWRGGIYILSRKKKIFISSKNVCRLRKYIDSIYNREIFVLAKIKNPTPVCAWSHCTTMFSILFIW